MEETHRENAERVRGWLLDAPVNPAEFRAALTRVPPHERDAWLNVVFGLDSIPPDGPELPPGCVPYLPCPVDAVLQAVDQAGMQASDVVVDVGSGVGRTGTLVQLLTGAAVIGVEIQPALVTACRELTARLRVERFSAVLGDAAQLTGRMVMGSVFFLYCPFGGERLEHVLDDLESIARSRPIRVCSVALPLPPRAWLTLAAPPSEELAVYRSNFNQQVGPLRPGAPLQVLTAEQSKLTV